MLLNQNGNGSQRIYIFISLKLLAKPLNLLTVYCLQTTDIMMKTPYLKYFQFFLHPHTQPQKKHYRWLAFVLIFPKKLCMRIYLAGKTKINCKKDTQKVVNIQWIEFPPVSYLWILRKICQTVAQHSDVQIEGQLLLYNLIVYLQWNNILGKE